MKSLSIAACIFGMLALITAPVVSQAKDWNEAKQAVSSVIKK